MAERKRVPTSAKRLVSQRAATTRRQNRQEDLREYLQGHQYIVHLNKIHKRVSSKWHNMDADQIGASRLEADICFRLLAKVLPDLKMVEIQGKIEHLHQEMSRIEIDGVLIAAGIEPDEMFKQLKLVK